MQAIMVCLDLGGRVGSRTCRFGICVALDGNASQPRHMAVAQLDRDGHQHEKAVAHVGLRQLEGENRGAAIVVGKGMLEAIGLPGPGSRDNAARVRWQV